MKKLVQEFKAFIMRGNVLDMAVGVIVGGAFNSIVTTLNKNILMPVVNWGLSHIPGMSSGLYTILPNSVSVTPGTADAIVGPDGLSYTVLNYIDWSAFIESILNFFFIALTLFIILKVFTTVSAKRKAFEEKMKAQKEAEDKAAQEAGLETPVVEEVVEEEAVEEAPAEPEKDPVVLLLEEIRDSLKAQEEKKKAAPKPKTTKTKKAE